MDWVAFWEGKAQSENDFQATGRGLMDVPGYLHTLAEVVRLLELKQGERLVDVGCGTGLIALSLSPWLSEVKAIDISPALIARARLSLEGLANIQLAVGSITQLPVPDQYGEKLLAYSVTQYLGEERNVSQAMQEISRVLLPGGRALLAANPDPSRRDMYEQVVKSRANSDAAQKEITLLDDLLWLPSDRMVRLANAAGLSARAEPISPRIWQHFYMFDLILTKPE